MAISVVGPTRGLVVVRVKAAPGAKGPPGYVTVRADIDRLSGALEDIGQHRFVGQVSLLLATADRKLVASSGVPGVKPGDSVAGMPIWRALPAQAAPDKEYSTVTEFADGDMPMVGAVQTL